MVATRQSEARSELTRAAVRTFAANERVNQVLLQALAPELWTAKPPGKVRTIAAIFVHLHNVRCKWVRLTAPQVGVPALLNRARCTQKQAGLALAESGTRCTEMLSVALSEGGGQFRRDGWAKAWAAGPEMLCYMVAHEAHHRGQVCLLAHQMGFPVSDAVTSEMWAWKRLWSDET